VKKIIPPSTKRVELKTNKKVNQIIKTKTVNRIKQYMNTTPEDITRRIKQLNNEWDTERVLETNASIFIVISIVLGFFISSNWFIFAFIVGFFLLVHAIYGWCPPLPIIRRLGVRTPEEINDEKTVMKFIRGDFFHLSHKPIEMFEIMEKD